MMLLQCYQVNKKKKTMYCTELYGGNVTHNAGLILLLISDKVTRNAGCVATKMTKKKSAIFQNFLALWGYTY